MPSALPVRRAWAPLSGGTAVWVFMSVEVLTFGLFMLGHAWGWQVTPQTHAQGQALLHVGSGVRGTVLLLLGSGLAYQAVLADEHGSPRRAASWLVGAAVAGCAFSANKILEYASPDLAGVTLSTSSFWFSYLFLTGLHLLHVLAGIGLLLWVAARLLSAQPRAGDGFTVSSVAAYWHLVDVIWVLLFPILYLMHP